MVPRLKHSCCYLATKVIRQPYCGFRMFVRSPVNMLFLYNSKKTFQVTELGVNVLANG